MKKVIISGITGQDGSYMAEYLLQKTDIEVIGGIRRTSQAILSNIQHLLDNPRFRLYTLDLCDVHSITNLIEKEKPDYFINFGASTFVADSWENPHYVMELNANSLIHILEAVRKYRPSCRVYSAGSSEQFGDVIYFPQDINHPYRPRSIYGVSKCAAAHICKVYRESYNLYVVHGILFNHESYRRQEYFVTRKITKGIAKIVKDIEHGEIPTPILLGNLDAKRDWSHAADFVDGIWRMLNQDIYRNDVADLISQYNTSSKLLLPREINPAWRTLLSKKIKDYVLSSNETHSVRDFCTKALGYAGLTGQWKGEGLHEKYFTDDGDPLVSINSSFFRPCEVDLLYGDSTPARQELGWTPRINFDMLVREMVYHDLNEN